MCRTLTRLLLAFWSLLGPGLALAQELPAPPRLLPYNHLSADWLVQTERGTLAPYLPEAAAEERALHQVLLIRPAIPFPISMTVRAGTCLFLNNRLVFEARQSGRYTLDLVRLLPEVPEQPAVKVLFTVWHPEIAPSPASFQNETAETASAAAAAGSRIVPQLRPLSNNSLYTLLLLLLGLFFGFLRVHYPTDFSSLFKPARFFRTQSEEEGFMNKSINSWSNLLFLLAFSMSLALVTVAIRQNLSQLLLPQVLAVPQAGVLRSVLTGTAVALAALLLKQVFLRTMAYIFNLERVVELQYREFVRSLLFFGLGLPVLLLFYLAFEPAVQAQVLTIINWVVIALLVVPMLRIFYVVGKKFSLKNLQLFSYLCGTEVLPLAIILKLAFLNY